MFNGDAEKFELWECKFLGHMRLLKLQDTVLPHNEGGVKDEEVDAEKNEDCFAELIQCIDDKSLSLIFRDGKNNGRKCLKLLRNHYLGTGKQRIIALYHELTSLKKASDEEHTEYLLRAENASAMLSKAEETVSDSLLIAMVLKNTKYEYKSFVTVTLQQDPKKFHEFREALKSFEDTMKSCGEMKTDKSDNVMMFNQASKYRNNNYNNQASKFGSQHRSENPNASRYEPQQRPQQQYNNYKKPGRYQQQLESATIFCFFDCQ